jgi:hypothetical protein
MTIKFIPLLAGGKCSKFATGDIYIVELLLAAYLIYVIVVCAVAFWLAHRQARSVSSGATRIWLLHAAIAVLVAAGPALPLIYLDLRAHIESVRWQKQFDLNHAKSVAWKNGLKFSPGSARKDIERALATIPKPYMIQYAADVVEAAPYVPRLEIKAKIVDELTQWLDAAWTQDDLDAFSSMADSNDLGLTALTIWARDRTALPAAAAVCLQATLSFSQSRDCQQTLGNAVSLWCRRDGVSCETLSKDAAFRKVVTGMAGVALKP